MLAVHLEGGRVEVREEPVPERQRQFALIRLRCAGICNTDLELKRGYYAFRGIPGHEFVGEVAEADNRNLIGRRVVGEINLACGECEWCARGLGRHCPSRTVLGIAKHPGAFSEFLTLPERNLYCVPDYVSDEHATFTEPVAAACEILDQVDISGPREVAVLGDGKLGLLIAQVLNLQGCAVRLFGKHPEKLQIAAQAGIATEIAGGEPRRAIFRWVVEATGTQDGLRQAIAMCEPRGFVVMKSTVHGDVGIDTATAIVNEITLVGSRCGRFEPALELVRTGKLLLDPMISARFPLREAPAAFETAERKGALKVLLDSRK